MVTLCANNFLLHVQNCTSYPYFCSVGAEVPHYPHIARLHVQGFFHQVECLLHVECCCSIVIRRRSRSNVERNRTCSMLMTNIDHFHYIYIYCVAPVKQSNSRITFAEQDIRLVERNLGHVDERYIQGLHVIILKTDRISRLQINF